MSDFVKEKFSSQLKFEGIDESDKFSRFFTDLYRIEIFKDGLDLIITKVQEKDLTFEVRIIKGWDTNLGCYLTEQSKIFNSVLGKFSRQIKKKIILKRFTHNVLAHEMAHALEFESGLNLGEEFRKCIALDMKNRQADSITLRSEIKRLMVDALKAYSEDQFLSELFARYFELLSISRDVRGSGDFTSAEVMNFFVNTTNFITKIFNPKIKNKIDLSIADTTKMIVERFKIEGPQKKFQDDVKSFYKSSTGGEKKSWAKNVKSNSMYQAGWNKYQEIEDKKNN